MYERLAAVAWFKRLLVMVSGSSDDPPAIRTDEQTPHIPLLLLRASIALDSSESSLCSGFLCALGFEACGTKFDKHELLYIGLHGPIHRRQRS
jgi:hypothetical protein